MDNDSEKYNLIKWINRKVLSWVLHNPDATETIKDGEEFEGARLLFFKYIFFIKKFFFYIGV